MDALRYITAPVFAAFLAAFSLPSRTAAAGESAPDGVEFFEKKIRPILVDRCYECHSEGTKAKGNLLLDSRDALLKGGDDGPAVTPGDPGKSLLIKAVRYLDEDLQMPPKHRLDPQQVADLEAWVTMGAPDPRSGKPPAKSTVSPVFSGARTNHWSFQPVRDPRPPEIRAATLGSERPGSEAWTSIDRFLLARLGEKGLTFNAPAEKRALLRRATFDLTGLPPTPEEMEAFLGDESPGAFAKVLDRLLASPHYGERWGRHWLDVVRYADTAGDSSDYPIPQAHKFRDYVIRSFNEDKPYDQFLREQIAGDLLAADPKVSTREAGTDAPAPDLIVATGYIALARRFGVNPESVQHLTIEDTIDNLGKATLGLSLGCARCHDHKYDPVASADYYALYGIFASTRYPFAGSENEKKQRDLVPLVPGDELDALLKPFREKLAPLDAEVKRLEEERDALRNAGSEKPKDAVAKADETSSPKDGPKRKTMTDIREEIRKAREKRDKFARTAPFYEKAFSVVEGGKTGDAQIQIRGEPGKKGDTIPRRFLSVLGGQTLPAGEKGSGRRQLAGWITDPANPLTARVMVNRIWQYHFGRGLVQTPSDFGLRGKAPTHPELLDWLATRFVERGWSIKSMHKLIMLSAAYRQSSLDHPKAAGIDPGNELLWKFNRRRLDAEAIRDAMLFVSGNLDSKTRVTHPFPAEERWDFTQHRPFDAVYASKHRSVYLMQQRIRKHPFLELFDGADPNVITSVRTINTTPLQALFMMNDPFAHEQASGLARRVISARPTDGERLDLAYQLALGRPPTREETEASLEHRKNHAARLAKPESPGGDPTEVTWSSLARVILSGNEFVYLD
jgi:hypothetical protein